MKKLFKAGLVFFSIFSLTLFSCKTTDSSIGNSFIAEDITENQENAVTGNPESEEEILEEKIETDLFEENLLEEKISDEEVQELNQLFDEAEALDNVESEEETKISAAPPADEVIENIEETAASNEEESKSQETIETGRIEIPRSETTAQSITENKTVSVNEPEKKEALEIPEEKPEVPSSQTIPEYNGTVDEEGNFTQQKEVLPSRTMAVKNNQFIDIVYPGTGWIYLGEQERNNIFIFHGRKMGDGETIFTLRSKKSGKALLHFYKNDPLTRQFIDDFLEVEVSQENAETSEHITAPSYAEAVPPKPDRSKKQEELAENLDERNDLPEASGSLTETTETPDFEKPWKNRENISEKESSQPQEKVQTVIQTSGDETDSQKTTIASRGSSSINRDIKENSSSDNTETLETGNLLERAWKAYNEKQFSKALSYVDQFLDNTAALYDEGLFLKGQILEAKSDVQDIKNAVEAYRTVTENYPESDWWTKARQRIIYLKRFYFDIR